MTRYLGLRLLGILPLAFGIVTGVFFLIHLLPGDPIDLILGENAAPLDRAALAAALHLDEPILSQYSRFLSALMQGDLGQSLSRKQPVATVILSSYPATLQLAATALLMAIGMAVPLGVTAALRKGSLTDNSILFFSLFGLFLPNFLLGPLLILVFALALDLLPVSGKTGFASLILPALTLGMGMAAILVRMTRSSLLDVLGQPFVVVARAKGISEGSLLRRHLLQNALIPLITLLGLQFGALLTGAVITETIFSWPGLGRLTISAILSRDYPLVQGSVLVIAISYLFVSLIVDLLYAWIDPRIRYAT